jgi:hypothetical protein
LGACLEDGWSEFGGAEFFLAATDALHPRDRLATAQSDNARRTACPEAPSPTGWQALRIFYQGGLSLDLWHHSGNTSIDMCGAKLLVASGSPN